MRVAVYVRVSTPHQSDEGQLQELQALCQRAGWEIAGTYRETASGIKGADQRPQLAQLLKDARKRLFGRVVVWSVCRLARSSQHLVNVLAELHDYNVELFSLRQGIDTSGPMGSALWQILGIFAEIEHGIRAERQALGIAKAKERGVKFGRPPIPKAKKEEIIRLRREGMGINKIGRTLRVGTGTVIRVLAAKDVNESKTEITARAA